MPVAYAAGFEKFFVSGSKLPGFHDVEVKHEGAEQDKAGFQLNHFDYRGIRLDSDEDCYLVCLVCLVCLVERD